MNDFDGVMEVEVFPSVHLHETFVSVKGQSNRHWNRQGWHIMSSMDILSFHSDNPYSFAKLTQDQTKSTLASLFINVPNFLVVLLALGGGVSGRGGTIRRTIDVRPDGIRVG